MTASPGTAPGHRGLTAVVTALREEADPLLQRLERPETLFPGSGEDTGAHPFVRRGRLHGRPVAVAVTGDGARMAHRGVRTYLEAVRPRRLLVLGVAGALAPGLEPHALLLAREVRREDGPAYEAPDGEIERVARATGLPTGVVVTVDHLLDSPEAKARLRARTLPGEDARAVADLESAHYVRAAEEFDVDWVVIRAVSDTADEGLPSYLNGCRDDGGAIRRGAVAREALRHPTSVPVLWRMRRRVHRCAEELAAVTSLYLREGDR